MVKTFKRGEYVHWSRHDREMRGRIIDIFIQEFTRTIEGQEFHRTPDIDHPSYLVETDNGEEIIVDYNQVDYSKDQNEPVVHDGHERMNEQKHKY